MGWVHVYKYPSQLRSSLYPSTARSTIIFALLSAFSTGAKSERYDHVLNNAKVQQEPAEL